MKRTADRWAQTDAVTPTPTGSFPSCLGNFCTTDYNKCMRFMAHIPTAVHYSEGMLFQRSTSPNLLTLS